MTVILKAVTVHLRLAGCRSLKEKRGRLGGLRDRLGKNPNIALCQSHFQNKHDEAEWVFALLASDSQQAQQLLALLEKTILETVDGEIISWDEALC